MLSLKSKSANAQTFYNVLSTIIRTGISFFTIPIFTRMLGTEQYGLYSLYLSWFNVINCIVALGCGQGLATGMYAFKEDYLRFRSSILFGGTVMCFISTIIGIGLYFPLSSFINYPFPVFLLLFLESTASFVNGFAGTVWTYEKKAAQNMILSLITLLSTTGLSLLLLLFWNYGNDTLYVARIIGVAVPTVIIGISVWCIIFFKKPTFFVKKYWIYSFNFGIPIVFHTLSQQILTSSDRIMMKAFNVSNSEIGIYSFFYTFVSILSAALGALNNSWVPFLYDDLDKKLYDVLNKKVKNYVQIFTVITFCFLMFSKEISRIFTDKEYWSGAFVMPIITVVIYLIFIYQFPVNYEFFKTKPQIVAYGTACAAILNIILNFIMIPMWGMYGAAIATLLSYGVLAGIHFIIVLKWKYEIYPLQKKSVLFGFIIVIITCILYYLLYDLWYIRWVLGICAGMYLVHSIWKRKNIF